MDPAPDFLALAKRVLDILRAELPECEGGAVGFSQSHPPAIVEAETLAEMAIVRE